MRSPLEITSESFTISGHGDRSTWQRSLTAVPDVDLASSTSGPLLDLDHSQRLVLTMPTSKPLRISACLGQIHRWCQSNKFHNISGCGIDKEEGITLEAVFCGQRLTARICTDDSDGLLMDPWTCDISHAVKLELDVPADDVGDGQLDSIDAVLEVDMETALHSAGLLRFNVWSVGSVGSGRLLESIPILLLPSDCMAAAEELSDQLSSGYSTETLDLFMDISFVLEGSTADLPASGLPEGSSYGCLTQCLDGSRECFCQDVLGSTTCHLIDWAAASDLPMLLQMLEQCSQRVEKRDRGPSGPSFPPQSELLPMPDSSDDTFAVVIPISAHWACCVMGMSALSFLFNVVVRGYSE